MPHNVLLRITFRAQLFSGTQNLVRVSRSAVFLSLFWTPQFLLLRILCHLLFLETRGTARKNKCTEEDYFSEWLICCVNSSVQNEWDILRPITTYVVFGEQMKVKQRPSKAFFSQNIDHQSWWGRPASRECIRPEIIMKPLSLSQEYCESQL